MLPVLSSGIRRILTTVINHFWRQNTHLCRVSDLQVVVQPGLAHEAVPAQDAHARRRMLYPNVGQLRGYFPVDKMINFNF